MRRRHKNEQQERVISYWTLSLVDEHFMCSNSSSTSREKCLCLLLCRIFGTHFSYFMCCASGRNSFHWNHKILQLDVLCCMCCLSTHGYMQAQIMFSLRLNLILLQFFMAGAEGNSPSAKWILNLKKYLLIQNHILYRKTEFRTETDSHSQDSFPDLDIVWLNPDNRSALGNALNMHHSRD